MAHLLEAELARLDRLIHREILRLRAAYEISLDEFRGLYISDEQVDALVRHRHGVDPDAPEDPPALIAGSRWAMVAERFDLTAVEHDLLLFAVAPEIDRKYETLFAYLNNEVGRRWPTLDLAGRLLRDADLAWRAASPDGTLVGSGLISLLPEFARRPIAAQEFAAAPAVGRFLRNLEQALPPGLRLLNGQPGPAGLLDRLARLPPGQDGPLVVLTGVTGCGRLQAAQAMAGQQGRRLLEIDLGLGGRPAEEVIGDAALVARLDAALVFIRGMDEALNVESSARARVIAAVDRLPGPLLMTASRDVPWPEPTPARDVISIAWPEPDAAQRRATWAAALEAASGTAEPSTLDALADRFHLTTRQIGRAARSAVTGWRLEGQREAATSGVPAPTLFRAAREQSGDALGSLAVRIDRRLGWNELVLPPATLARLHDVAAAIANRGLVQRTWRMGRLSLSPDGLAVLFQGVSGTGKTMAASVIAGELGLDLYRIELAGVVSKYIGETEKNLDRIFRAARRSNAILLFDEADALFGRRSEVKDAHDRYANLEVAYLLQRMEEHDGPVILATNLARNMDQAFARRLHYIVEFPKPDVTGRESLWRQMLAPPLPCADDVDPCRLAKVFDLTGGEIRKTALEAAFVAAANGRVVTMAQLVTASTRELQRQGKVISAREIAPLAVMAGHAS
jgi:hypothetical protein